MYKIKVWSEGLMRGDEFPTIEHIAAKTLYFEENAFKCVEIVRKHARNIREYGASDWFEYDYLYCRIDCEEFSQTTRFKLV